MLVVRAWKPVLLALLVGLAASAPARAGERLSLDEGWRFLQGDVALPQIKGHGASYTNAQTGQADGPRNADFDDSHWAPVKLPPQAEQPDPNRVIPDNDMNSWGWGEPPMKQGPEALRWRSYRAPIQLRGDRNDGRAHLVFREIIGKAEVWVDGVKLGEKTTAAPGALKLPLAKGANWRTMTLLLESEPGQASGVIGPVIVEPGTP